MLTGVNNKKMLMNWKRTLGLFFLALSPLVITSCLDDEDAADIPPVAYVAYYHGSPETGAVSIYADGRLYNTNNFEYTDFFTYGNYYTGERNLSFKNKNAANSLLDTTVTLNENQPYTFFFIDGEESAMETVIAEDNWDEPSEGKAMIRLVHLSPDAPAVNLVVNDDEAATFSNQEYKNVTDFVEIDAELTSFSITNSTTGEVILTAEDLDLRTQRIYTFIVRGYAAPEETASSIDDLSLQVIRNYPNY